MARARLLVWQRQEREFLADWWHAEEDREQASAVRDGLVGRRDRAVSRLLGGMTAQQREWAEEHLMTAALPRDVVGRRLVLRWSQRREDVVACEAAWEPRIAEAEQRLVEAEERLQLLTYRAVATWGPAWAAELIAAPAPRGNRFGVTVPNPAGTPGPSAG